MCGFLLLALISLISRLPLFLITGNTFITEVTKPGDAAELFPPVAACNSDATATGSGFGFSCTRIVVL